MTGVAIGSAGGALLIGGGIGYGVAKLELNGGAVGCHAPAGSSCMPSLQAAADIDTMIVGGVHLGIGLVFTLVGLSRHD